MTTLAVELSVDSRGPCAIYIASDSRITWGDSGKRWDAAQKTFISNTSADIFGYCGSAFVPTQVLNQVARQIEAGILFDARASADERHGRWLNTIKASISNSSSAQFFDFSILHGARDGVGIGCTFHLWKSTFTAKSKEWKEKKIPINTEKSYFVSLDGTGASHLRTRIKATDDTQTKSTSRGAFQQFFQSLKDGDDDFSGGAPQVVGIFRVREPQHFGLVWKDSRYYCGSEVVAGSNFNKILWFNELFERADGRTKKLLKGAQKH
ncbi:hypothetical protein [Pacificibacter marinus]|uniref:Uncharacterized protein n=1 Tax=Pacificibacter marinus TaxID=658057 RepID=A0A1Y5TRF3_9RHOB|nr:hypothetical protein [Pacificibacter marinus]SEK55367.1 hypothetical protein SAMN04488032_103294 [Pacificibacter marinus]SLN67991.1 hypothetical protein PAM7971_03609 [Pacificibacter marinus]